MSNRILFVVNHAGFFLSHRLPIALAALAAGYEVHVATPRSKHVPRIIAAGLTWHEIALSRSGKNPIHEMRTLYSLQRLYRSVNPNIVHHVTSKPVLYGTPLAKLVGVPAVVNAISGLGHVFASDNMLRFTFLRAVVGIAYRISLRHPRMRVVFQNPEHRDLFIKRRWVRASDCVLIPGSGVDPEEFHPVDRDGPERPPQVVFASRMLRTKGLYEFVEASRSLKKKGMNARFVLIGEPDPDNLASVPQEQIDRWVAEGIVEYRGRSSDMVSVFAAADVVCLPTYYPEGMPKVLIEAASCALPIVTTDIPGCRDIVRHGENGLLVPVRNAASVAEALERLLNDRELRKRMGRCGRERVLEKFALPIVVARTLDLYRELVT